MTTAPGKLTFYLQKRFILFIQASYLTPRLVIMVWSALVFLSVPPGFALIADVQIADGADTSNQPALVVEFQTTEGLQQVRLSPQRFRELGILDAFMTGRHIPIPKP
jgi:hypothetical protein